MNCGASYGWSKMHNSNSATVPQLSVVHYGDNGETYRGIARNRRISRSCDSLLVCWSTSVFVRKPKRFTKSKIISKNIQGMRSSAEAGIALYILMDLVEVLQNCY